MKTMITLVGVGLMTSMSAAGACEFHTAQAAANTQVAMTDQATPVTPEHRAEQLNYLRGMSTNGSQPAPAADHTGPN